MSLAQNKFSISEVHSDKRIILFTLHIRFKCGPVYYPPNVHRKNKLLGDFGTMTLSIRVDRSTYGLDKETSFTHLVH